MYWGSVTEDVLIKSSIFKLPGKKKLLESEAEPKVIVIDVTESTIERHRSSPMRLRLHCTRFTIMSP